MTSYGFAMVSFDDQLFTPSKPTASRTFTIEGVPDDGYLLIQIHDVESGDDHRIVINDHDLPGFDLSPSEDSEVWTTWMDPIPSNFLVQGKNRIAIHQGGDDSFTVRTVVVHWRGLG